TAAIAAPLCALAIAARTPATFLVALGLAELAIFVSTSPTNAAILMPVPATLRASAMALSIFAIHLLGDLISPPLVASIADRFGDSTAACSGAHGLTVGLMLLPTALALAALFWFRGARGLHSPR